MVRLPAVEVEKLVEDARCRRDSWRMKLFWL